MTAENVPQMHYVCLCANKVSVEVDIELLARHCQYFQAATNSAWRETDTHQIDLELVPSDLLTIVVSVVEQAERGAGGESKLECLDLETTSNLLRAADYLDSPTIHKACQRHLCSMALNDGNLARFLTLMGDFPSLERLQERLTDYLCQGMARFFNNDQIVKEMPESVLRKVLSSPSVQVATEWHLVLLIDRWISRRETPDSPLSESVVHSLALLIKVPDILVLSSANGAPAMLNKYLLNFLRKQTEMYELVPHLFAARYPQQCSLRQPVEAVLAVTTDNQSLKASLVPLRDSPRFAPLQQTPYSKPFDVVFQRLVDFAMCTFGPFVFLAGGHEFNVDGRVETLSFVNRLDLRTVEWTQVASMTQSRCSHTLEELGGNIIAVGGVSNTATLDSVEYLSPETAEWKMCAPLPHPVFGHASCMVNDSCLYVCGGIQTLDQAGYLMCLCKETMQWTECTPLLTARTYHTMTPWQSCLYVVGGMKGALNCMMPCMSYEVYDIKKDQWTALNGPKLNPVPLFVISLVHEATLVCVGACSCGEHCAFHCLCREATSDGVWSLDLASGLWHLDPTSFQRSQLTEPALKVTLKKSTLLQLEAK